MFTYLRFLATNVVITRSYSAAHDGLDMAYWHLWQQVGDCYIYLNSKGGLSYTQTKMKSQDYETIHAATQLPSVFDVCWGYIQLEFKSPTVPNSFQDVEV